MIPLFRWPSYFVTTALATASLILAINYEQDTSLLPSRYLVSLNRAKSTSRPDFKSHLNNKGVKHEISLDMTNLASEVFHGLSVRLADEDDLKHVESFAHVEKISPVNKIARASTFHRRMLDGPIDSTPSLYPPQVQTRITELHKMGIYGDGVKVALIDAGIDCSHPALGKGFGPGFKIAFGKNYVVHDDKDDGDPDSPCSQCNPHGTHLAGILAAEDAGYGFVGVAPNVTLGMYRVFGCGENDDDSLVDTMLAAMLQAHKDGADIILIASNLGSWGQDDKLLTTINTLVQKQGAIIIASAGDEGWEGLFHSDHPATAKNAISVGSIDSSALIAGKFKASTGKELMIYRAITFNLTGEYPVYITANSTDDPSDACEELPTHTPNLANHIVLVKQGNCGFMMQTKNVVAKGGKQILFYMNSTSILSLPHKILGIHVSSISLEDGKYIFHQTEKDPKNFTLSFPPTKHYYMNNPDGGFGSNFSLYGPSFDFASPQPAVSGVGGNVVSTFPMKEGGYSSLVGTSMASSQIAGVAALILSARGKKFTGITMRSRLATTTKLINRFKFPGLDSAVHQGGGLIDAFCAVWTNTTVSVPGLILGESTSFRATQEFTVFNNGTGVVNYILTHRPAVTLQTFSHDTKYGRPDVQPTLSNQSSMAQISPERFSVQPGLSQVVKVNFSAPQLDHRWLAVYSGFIVMSSDAECESHNVPYHGVVGSLKKQSIIDQGPNPSKTANYPYLTYESEAEAQSPLNTDFVWDLKQHSAIIYQFRTLFGTPLLRIDVLPGNANLSNPTRSKDFEKSFRGSPLIGFVPDSEALTMPRSRSKDSYHQPWNATIVTQTNKKPHFLPDGSYKLLLRALRMAGHKTNEVDYEYWVSPEFKLKNSRGK